MDKYEAVDEMIEYILENRVTSYYEFKDYIKENKPKWLPLFNNRNTRIVISECIKNIRVQEQSKGNKTPRLYESLTKIIEKNNSQE